MRSRDYELTYFIVNGDMVWKLGKLQSDYNELRFDIGTVFMHRAQIFCFSLINI